MASNDGSAPRAERQPSSELPEMEETIEVADGDGILRPKLALKTWKGEVNQIRENCLTSLGHSITDENGTRRKTIILTWGCQGLSKTWRQEFQIVTDSSHPIMLGLELSDKVTDAKRGKQAFPAFSRRLKKEAKKERETQRAAEKIRRDREIKQEAKEKLERILQQRQQQPQQQPVEPRL